MNMPRAVTVFVKQLELISEKVDILFYVMFHNLFNTYFFFMLLMNGVCVLSNDDKNK
jgi:hypothetical protein